METDNENIPQFSLHVNFWSLEDIKTKENINTPFLDIGIKIKNYKQLDHITFYCPFYLDKKGIVDLSEKLASKNNASIILIQIVKFKQKIVILLLKLQNIRNNY